MTRYIHLKNGCFELKLVFVGLGICSYGFPLSFTDFFYLGLLSQLNDQVLQDAGDMLTLAKIESYIGLIVFMCHCDNSPFLSPNREIPLKMPLSSQSPSKLNYFICLSMVLTPYRSHVTSVQRTIPKTINNLCLSEAKD